MSEPTSLPGAGTTTRASVAAGATDARKDYGEGEAVVHALDGVTVSFERARFNAIMGPSGSGKSTLMHCLAGLDRLTAGRVYIGDTYLDTLSDSELTELRRDTVGFVFQAFNLIPTLTVIENLLLPLELNGRTGRPARAAAMELLGRVGLADRNNTYPDRLSGGEQQRVAVARAVVHDPVLLLADEPTGSLDAETGTQLLELLLELARNEKRTMVVVTHSDAVAGAADRVLVLQGGRLVDGTFSGGATE